MVFGRKKVRHRQDAVSRTHYTHLPYDNNAIVTGVVVASAFDEPDSNDSARSEPVFESTVDAGSYSDTGGY